MRETTVDWKCTELVVGDPYGFDKPWGRLRLTASGDWYYQASRDGKNVTDGTTKSLDRARDACEVIMSGEASIESIRGHRLACAVKCGCG